jgi:hypothetical protein
MRKDPKVQKIQSSHLSILCLKATFKILVSILSTFYSSLFMKANFEAFL